MRVRGTSRLSAMVGRQSQWIRGGPAERSDDITSKVDRFLMRRELVGIVLTGFDDDHADPDGLDWLLEDYAAAWVMYPKYYKETENARLVFNVIRKHERRRENT